MKALIILVLIISLTGILLISIRDGKETPQTTQEQFTASPPRKSSQNADFSHLVKTIQRPVATHPEKIRAYMRVMEEKGHRFESPIPSKHILACSEQTTADELLAWAKANDFEESTLETGQTHFGDPQYYLTLQRTTPISFEQVDDEASLITQVLSSHSDAQYTTWLTGNLVTQ